MMKDALLDREDCNVTVVDRFGGSRTMRYGQAAGNTRLVGVQVAELAEFLIFSSSGSPGDWADRFYVIGFRLGSQVAGYARRHLRANGMELGRITGKLSFALALHTHINDDDNIPLSSLLSS